MERVSLYVHTLLSESERDLRGRIPAGIDAVFSRDLPYEQRQAAFLSARIAYGLIPPAWLADTTRLDWLQLESVGLDGYTAMRHESWVQRVRVSNVKGFFGVPVAETLVAGLLALYRGLDQLLPLQAQADWQGKRVRASLRVLHGSRALILGAGSIGLHARQLLEAFGCRCLVFARHAQGADARSVVELEALLPTVDLVIGCLPDTSSTRDLLDRRRLGLLRSGAVVANGGRGSLIDEVALREMLESGRLSGAVLDVTRTEPLAEDDPLWRCPHLILTQHTSGGSQDEVPGKNRFFLDNLQRYLRGERLMNLVDLSRAE